MKKIDYKNLLKQAFLITWKNKFLWIFGFFILLGSFPTNLDSGTGSIYVTNLQQQMLSSIFVQHPLISFTFSILLVFLLVFVVIVKILGTASIIISTNNINIFKQASTVTILAEAKKFVGRLFLVELITFFYVVALMIVLIVPVLYLFKLNAIVFAWFSIFLAAIICLALILLAYVLRKYAYMYIVLGDMKVKLAFELAYTLLDKNKVESLFIIVTSFLLNLTLIIILALVIFLMIVLFVPLFLIVLFIFGKTIAAILATVSAVAISILVLSLLSWFESFFHAIWVLFFQQIALEKKDDKKESEEEIKVEGELPTPEAI